MNTTRTLVTCIVLGICAAGLRAEADNPRPKAANPKAKAANPKPKAASPKPKPAEPKPQPAEPKPEPAAARPAPASPKAEAFEALLQKIQTDPGGAGEADVRTLLTLGKELGRPYTASLAVKGYLSYHARPSESLLLMAAENALWAGDHRAAVSRYKGYLRSAEASAQAAEAAAELYTILIDFLADPDDAYQFMTQFGEKFRTAPAARRFDGWYVQQAIKRKDHASLARRLVAVFSEKMPIEKERLFFWDSLDWLLEEISRGRKEHFDALPDCRKLAGLIRDSRRRSLQCGLYVANLAFNAGSAGKEKDVLDAEFAQVVSAAKAYVDALPTAATVQDVCETFGGGAGAWSVEAWNRQRERKQEFFVHAFGRLSDADREAMMAWNGLAAYLATPQQWAALGIRHTALFARSEATRLVPFARRGDKALFLAQAKFLRGVDSYDAAVINSLAAGADDLLLAVDHLVRNELWHLRCHQAFGIMTQEIIPAFKEMHAGDKRLSGSEYAGKAMVRLGRAVVEKTPLPMFDPSAAGQYLSNLWYYGDSKADMIAALKALEWVPWDFRVRRQVIGGTQNAFRSWARQITAESKRKDAKVDPADLKLIAPLEAAFQKVVDQAAGDPGKAPDALCKNLALAALALETTGRDAPQFVAPAREVYKLVADYDVGKVPFGSEALRYVLRADYRQGRRNLPFLCEVIADQLARHDPKSANLRIREVVGGLLSGRYRDETWRVTHQDKEASRQVSAVLEKALTAQLEQGRFWLPLFNWFRSTRSGLKWSGLDWGEAVMEKVLTGRFLEKTGARPVPGIPSATCSYMWLIRHEFPRLAAKYPVETWFDDMFVAEAAGTGYLDWSYWDQGRDEKKKVVNAAAKVLGEQVTLPFGYNGEKAVYSRSDFWNWQGRAFNADKALCEAMMARIEACYGKTRFDAYAMGRQYFSTAADVTTEKGRKEFFERLSTFLDQAAQAPARLSLPYLGQLASIADGKKLSEAEAKVLVGIFPHRSPGAYARGWHYEKLVTLIAQALIAADRQAELYPLVPHFWHVAGDTGEPAFLRALADLGKSMLARNWNEMAHVYAAQGIDQLKGLLPGDTRATMLAVRSRSLSEMGGIIPVKPGDPRHGVFAAQAAYLTGKFQHARDLYMPNRARVLTMFKDLDPQFCVWLIDQEVEAGEYGSAEKLARSMSQWFEDVGGDFRADLRGQLEMSFADIFFARQEYPIAAARYKSIATAKEYEGTQARTDAELKLAEVYRLTKRYDLAVADLEKLAARMDKQVQAQAYYQLALVKFDQEEYREAREALDKVFVIVPDHSDGRILEGKVFLKLKRVELATEIEAGTPTRRNFLVPGSALSVTLVDQNLSIVGGSANVELRAWTDSGDEEFFSLIPFGDSKTKFRGRLPTALAATVKGDGVLQVLGQENVYFDFSESVKKASKIAGVSRNTLTVVTDGEVVASSGAILTKEERERQALEEAIRRRMKIEAEAPDVALSTVRLADQIKPGNPINVRVIDPDRSTTAGSDAIEVAVATSSGDRIKAFTLRETGTHTGLFEGAVPTASGQATAYASDTEAGKDANFAISAKDYGPWVAQADNVRPKTFSIDLNDNAAPDKMTVLAGVTLRKLKSFQVQTSLNGRDFTTVAAWPEKYEPWDGSLRMEMVKFVGKQVPNNLAAIKEYLDTGCVNKKMPKVVVKATDPSIQLDASAGGQAGKLGLTNQDDYIVHLSGAFYQAERRRRSFQLVPREDQPGRRGYYAPQYYLTVDGQEPRARGPAGESGITLSLGKGVHRIDVYVVNRRGTKAAAELMWDTEKAPYWAPCPAEIFDLAKNPEIRAGIYRDPGLVASAQDDTAFEVKFPAETRARVIRLVLLDFETDAPAINRISLTDERGKALLPAKEDFMTLRDNGTLEIVPGDKITVTYKDAKVLTEGKEVQEATLRATYGNATVSACFVEYELGREGQRKPRYVPMRRFSAKDNIQVFIQDPDMDVSAKLDTVKFTAKATSGEPVELVALETDKHSGIFIGTVFPVAGEPKRASELTVKPGDDVTLTYLDRDNTDPGIPWERTAVVEQVYFKTPELWVYDVKSEPDEPKAVKPPAGKAQPAAGAALADEPVETVPPSRRMFATRPDEPVPARSAAGLIGGPCLVEVVFPTIAKSPESTAAIYVQTSSGLKAAGKEAREGEFDVTVPGTLRLVARPGEVPRTPPPPGYTEVIVENKRAMMLAPDQAPFGALDDGRFSFSVPMELGKLPEKPLVPAEAPEGDRAARPAKGEEPKLMIKGGDEVFIGFQYADKDGAARWLTRGMVLGSDGFFHVTDRRYRGEVSSLYVGEKAYFRVIDPKRDTSDEADTITITLAAASGKPREVKLSETLSHSGVFKGQVKFVYRDAKGEEEFDTMAVGYGDEVTATYQAPGAAEKTSRMIGLFKGFDGLVLPFSKRFKDPDMAVKTQLMVAESYLELAKRHRELGEVSAARREIAQGKKLLEEAMRDYPQAEARAHTEYLLADLALEFANDAANEQLKKDFHNEAITRYGNIVASYPESEHAPKAQYKRALTLEKMGRFDEACEEYVKLSYRYPGNELVAETIARLGQYFLLKGKDLRKAAEAETDQVQREAVNMKARKMFKTAGQVLGRLSERFPSHSLAGRTLVLSAQCYVNAEDYAEAINVFEAVIKDAKQEPDLVAESMYWCGDSYLRLPAVGGRRGKPGQQQAADPVTKAYQMFKRLDWDYPTTKWARFARGRLASDERFTKMEVPQ